jgi:outer membrane protein
MKRVFLIIAIASFSSAIVAQEQGEFLLSGATGLNYGSLTINDIEPGDLGGTEVTTSTLELEISAGYFVTDELAVGITIVSESEQQKADYGSGGGTSEDKESTTLIGPMLRYYIAETGLFGQLSYLFGSNKAESSSGSSSYTDELKVSALGFGLGYGISLSDDVRLSPQISYLSMKTTLEDGAYDSSGNQVDYVTKMGGISFGLGLSLMLGS